MSTPGTRQFDLIVIGSGAGSMTAAARAAALGLRCGLAAGPDGNVAHDRSRLLASLLKGAAALHRSGAPAARFDWQGLGQRVAAASAWDPQAAGVTVLPGRGRLDGPGRVLLEGPQGTAAARAPRIILATGWIPAGLPGVTADGRRILNVDHLLDGPGEPGSLLVVGGGPAGFELASLMGDAGCRVTVAERGDQLLPGLDPDCSAAAAAALAAAGIAVRPRTRVQRLIVTEDGVSCLLDDRRGASAGDERSGARFDRVLLATGRRPATAGLGLETVGVVLDRRGRIQVDSTMQTAEPGLYAIGDLVPTSGLEHVAEAEALAALSHATGSEAAPVRYHQVPLCLRGRPQLGAVGLTAAAAAAAGYLVRCGQAPLDGAGPDAGFVKVVADAETGRVLGVHLVGADVGRTLLAATAALGLGNDRATWRREVTALPALAAAVAAAVDGGGPASAAGEPS